VTIAELLEQMQQYPPDTEVWVQAAPDGSPVEPEPVYHPEYDDYPGLHL
jgi:hypothetical protein